MPSHESATASSLRRRSSWATWLKVIRWGSGIAIVIAVLLLARMLPAQQILTALESSVDGLGIWGPVALAAIYVVAVLLLVPGSVLTLAAGALYGLLTGAIIVSAASTTAVALAYLIGRYLARDTVRRKIAQSPKLAAVDDAIGKQGWKIVLLLRLSPALPFSLQNYLYGVTAVRFWPCVIASWIGMMPGTFLYVYLGSLGRTAAQGRETTPGEWAIRGVGLIATIAVTVYLAKLARRAIQSHTAIEDADADQRRILRMLRPPKTNRRMPRTRLASTMLEQWSWDSWQSRCSLLPSGEPCIAMS